MPSQIADTRTAQNMTVEQADELFAQLAQADIRVKKAQAAAEKKIADIKEKCLAETQDDAETVKELAEELARYILENKNRFAKPRQRRTPFGKYGLRTATKLVIYDEQAAIDIAAGHQADITSTKVTIDRKLVELAMADGVDFRDSAKMVSGDIATYDVDRKLLKA